MNTSIKQASAPTGLVKESYLWVCAGFETVACYARTKARRGNRMGAQIACGTDNLGICTGQQPGGFAVISLDVDSLAALATLEARLGPLPTTLEYSTGRGDGAHQRLFRVPADRVPRNSVGALEPGIDVRGEGGLTVLPPSIHKSGKQYAWQGELAEVVPMLLDLFDATAGGKPPDCATNHPAAHMALLPEAWLNAMLAAKPSTAAGNDDDYTSDDEPANDTSDDEPINADPSAITRMQFRWAVKLGAFSQAAPGTGRNAQLNAIAYWGGRRAEYLGKDPAEQLFDAAERNGYVDQDGESVARATIESGWNAGEANALALAPVPIPTVVAEAPIARTKVRLTDAAFEGLAKSRRGVRAQTGNILLRRLADGLPVDEAAVPILIEALCNGFPLVDDESIADQIAFARSTEPENILPLVVKFRSTQTPAGRATAQADFQRGDHAELSDALLKEFDGAVYADGSYWQADASHLWQSVDDAEVTRAIKRFAGKTYWGARGPSDVKINASDVNGINALARVECTRPDFFAGKPVCVLQTEAFAVDGGRLVREPLTVEHHARWRHQFDWTDNDPAGLLNYFAGVFKGDDDADAKRDFLQEFGGAVLLGIAPRFQRCVFLRGLGGDGKSQILEVLQGIMPPGTVSHVTPQHLSNEYYRAKLAGRLLNVVAEMPQAEVIASENFKAIVTGDPIDGRPPCGQIIEFRPIAGHIFSANRLPPTQDQTLGFWRRPVVIAFNRFIPKEEVVLDLGTKLVAEERREIVCWFLRGAMRLLKRGNYAVPASHTSELDKWKQSADSVRLWLSEHTNAPPESALATALVSKAEAYRDYRDWAQASGIQRGVSRPEFTTRMTSAGHVAKRRPLSDGNKTSGELYDLVFSEAQATAVKEGEMYRGK